MSEKTYKRERRTLDQLKEAYEIEKELASKLRNATKDERKRLYCALYDEWNERVFRNKYLTPQNDSKSHSDISLQKKLLHRFLKPDFTFIEIGPGECNLAVEIAQLVKKVYVLDVSRQMTDNSKCPQNFEFIIYDGCNIPLPQGGVNVAYSNQLMEHLHPDDANEQLRSIYDVLTNGGLYLCMTPNRLYGPHDISGYFDDVATGFHLKEYTVTELVRIFKKVGFSKIWLLLGAKGVYISFPALPICWLEGLLSKLPNTLSKKISSLTPIKLLLGIKLIGKK